MPNFRDVFSPVVYLNSCYIDVSFYYQEFILSDKPIWVLINLLIYIYIRSLLFHGDVLTHIFPDIFNNSLRLYTLSVSQYRTLHSLILSISVYIPFGYLPFK